jgi:hypothetical protein
MKKSLFIFVTLFLTISVAAQDRNERHLAPRRSGSFKSPASVENWATMKGNFVAADIKGNVHDLQAYLDAGKTVIIDYSTIWCGPCWQFHQSGVLDQLHNNYGPGGTDELVVLWVEIDEETTLDEIKGAGDITMGDWTRGGTWPVPIINDVPERLCLAPLAELFENFVPTIFMVCPSGVYREITDEIRSLDGANLVYSLLGTCPDDTSLPAISLLNGPTENYVAKDNKFRASFFSSSDATATLTFEGGTPGTTTWTSQGGTKTVATENATTVAWEKAGTYEIKVEVTNSNGTAEKAQTIEIFDLPESADNKIIDFEAIMTGGVFTTDFFPYNWISVDKDNGYVYQTFRDQGVIGESSFVIVDKRIIEEELVSLIEPYEGNKCAMSMASHSGIRNDDWFISPKIQLGSESSISLYVRSGGVEDWGAEEYRIAVSTTNQNPASFTAIGGKRTAPFKWEKVEVNLSAYDNQEVYIAINNVGLDHFTFLVDNIEIKTKNASSVDKLLSSQFSIFPNPAKNTVNVNCPGLSKVQLFNIQGKEVMSVAANSENETINVSNLPEGHYLIMVTTRDNKIGTQKMTVVKE